MSEIRDYARGRGIKRLFGDVLRENQIMLTMARELGFRIAPGATGSEVLRVECDLSEQLDTK